MYRIKKIKVINGVYWIEIPDARLFVLCGCPADVVKHLKKRGLILPVERDGVAFESGPNAILLSEVLIQNEQFSNLAEFPVMQMLYNQGLILPNHPNNTGDAPLLIGTQDQVDAHKEYIFRGNYGLTSLDELQQAGFAKKQAEEYMRMKLRFAYGKIRKTDELLDSHYVEKEFTEIRNRVFIRHTGVNRFEFRYKQETVSVDLNLDPGERYPPPYDLGFHQIKREYFSVVHSGEGDGWDINRPSMSSILTFQEKIYLVDAGPNILNSLNALGISLGEVEGVFHTHSHDDHFAGLPSLLSSEHRLKYFATPLVRASVTKKLCALMSISDEKFAHYFEIHDLEFDVWNKVNALEVKPILSPHPVENNIFIFRTFGQEGYRSYAHWADMASFDVLEGMVTKDPRQPGISKRFYNKVKAEYLQPIDLKKIDIGGGLIHGNSEDFREDPSDKIILAHTSDPLTPSQKAVGSSSSFGSVDVLIPANRDYLRELAEAHFFKTLNYAPRGEVESLLNSPIEPINAGSVLLKVGEKPTYVYYIVSGVVEILDPEKGESGFIGSSGTVGSNLVSQDLPSPYTYRTASYVYALKMHRNLMEFFGKNNNVEEMMTDIVEILGNLRRSWLFRSFTATGMLFEIAKETKKQIYAKGEIIFDEVPSEQELLVIKSGKVQLTFEGTLLDTLGAGDVFGEERFVYNVPPYFMAQALERTEVMSITNRDILNIPMVDLKLRSLYEKHHGIVALIYQEQ